MKLIIRELLKLRNSIDDLAKSLCTHVWSKFNYSGFITYTCRICGKVDSTRGGINTEQEWEAGEDVF